MRNLKKALALVMVFALVLGTVASAASFSDIDAGYAYVEEVELLADLGVLAGFPDGSYQPEATITRVQAAAVIYRILTGRQSAAMYDGATKFYDVAATYWGTGYINYCADIGAIGGYPDGSFRPDQAITVAEYESMLVRALGLTEGRTLSYPNGYLALADANLINEDVPTNIAANSAADRGLVSKLTYNTIVNATYQTLATRDEPDPKIIEKIFKIVPYEGIVTGTRYSGVTYSSATTVGATLAEDKFNFVHTNQKTGEPNMSGTYKFAKVTSDMLGQKVKLYIKTTAAKDESVYAVVTSSDNKVVNVSMGNYGTDSEGTYYKVNGVKNYVTVSGAVTYVNGAAAAVAPLGKNVLTSVTLISNEGSDNSIEYVFAKNYTYAEYQQTANDKIYTDQKIVELKATNGDVYDVSADSGLVSGDKVLVYKDTTGKVGEVLKAETVEATLDGISGSASGGDLKYTFNGATKTAVVELSGSSYIATDKADNLADSSNLGKAAKFVVAPFFGLVLETSQGTGTVANYYYLKDTAQGSGFDSTKNLVKAVNTKGETVTLTFKANVGVNTTTAVAGSTDELKGYQGSSPAKDPRLVALLDRVFVLTVNSSNEITAMKTPDYDDSTVKTVRTDRTIAGLTVVTGGTLTTAYGAAAGADFAYTGTNIEKNPYSESTKLLDVKAVASGSYVSHKIDDTSVFFVEDAKGDVYVYVGTFPSTLADNMQMKLSYSKDNAYSTIRAGVLYAKNKPTPTTNVYGMVLDSGSIAASSDGQAYANYKMAINGEVKTMSTTSVAYSDTNSILKDTNGNSIVKGSVVEFSLTSDGKIALDSNKYPFATLVSWNTAVTYNGTTKTFATNRSGNIGYVSDFSGNVLAVTNEGYKGAGVPTDGVTTVLFKVADDVKVYEVDKNDIGAAKVSARGAVQVIKVTTEERTKVAFVYDLSSSDSAMQKVTEIYVIK